MIAFLTGQLRFKSPEYSIIDVQGVGYQVVLPLSSFYELPPFNKKLNCTSIPTSGKTRSACSAF